jgi:hypothetical protein
MEPSLQPLLALLETLSDEFREVREGLLKAVDIADRDPEMALTRTRKVLEFVVREVYQRRVGKPPGTNPLENLVQRLVKDGHFPTRLDAYATTVRKLGNVSTHTCGEAVTAADVRHSLSQLAPILEWYLEAEGATATGHKAPPAGGPRADAAPSVDLVGQRRSGNGSERQRGLSINARLGRLGCSVSVVASLCVLIAALSFIVHRNRVGYLFSASSST